MSPPNGNGNGNGSWIDVLRRLDEEIRGKEGLIVRVDRLEQVRLSANERWALYMALFFGFVNVLASFGPVVVTWLRQ